MNRPTQHPILRSLLAGSALALATLPASGRTIAYSSFEEPTATGGSYVDTLEADSDHALLDNPGQPVVNHTGITELGFASFYINTRNDVGLTDGDFIGVTNFTGDVGSFTEGSQGYEFQDPDGTLRLEFATVDLSTEPAAHLYIDCFVNETGWESNDAIRILVETDLGDITLLDTIGADIDDLGIEDAWFTLYADLSGSAWARLVAEVDSNAATESVYLDNLAILSAPTGEPEPPTSTATHTSFEEPANIGGQYIDTLSADSDHALLDNAGQPVVNFAGNEELGFRTYYVNTRNDVGLTDGDFIGVTNFTGTVGAFTEGSQGFQLSDTDGLVRVEFDTIDLSLVDTFPTLLIDLFVASTGWESDDAIRIWIETDTGTVTLLDTTGSDIDDLAIEGSWQTLSADLSDASVATLKVSLDCNAAAEAIFLDHLRFGDIPSEEPVTIMEIQGNAHASPYPGQQVTTSGIVTAITADNNSFWIQDPAGDNDPSTSDAIFVYSADSLPALGDLVEISGAVSEYRSSSRPTDLTLTELSGATVSILSSNNPLPAPVAIVDMPNESIADAIAFLEPLEGMRISIGQAFVVGQTNQFGEFHVVTAADAVPGSGFSPAYSQVLLRSTGSNLVDYNPERLMLDDLTLDAPIDLLPGDSLQQVTGIMHYAFSSYRIAPTQIDSVDVAKSPTPIDSNLWWNAIFRYHFRNPYLEVATFNVENLFDLQDDPNKNDESSTPSPEFLETKLDKLAATIGIGLAFPEIVAVQEVENTAVLQQLADRINQNAFGNITYQAISFETSDARGIETGFLYNPRSVQLVDAYQLSDDIVPGVSTAFGPQSGSPGREPLVAVFKHQGQTLTIVNNHFKSKGGDEPLYGVNQPPVRPSESLRKVQASVVRAFVEQLLAQDPDANVAVTGDFNDFQFGEPGEGPDHTVGILEGQSPALTNLVNTLVPEGSRFSYLYEGNSQALDHFLVSPKLRDAAVWADFIHVNAAYLDSFMEDSSVLERSSDHDPFKVRLLLNTNQNQRGGLFFW